MAGVERNTGIHDFMILSAIDNGYSLHRFDPELMYQPGFRYILGSPLMAACMQKVDNTAELQAPVELSIQKVPIRRSRFVKVTGMCHSTVVRYMLPSSVIAPKEELAYMDKAVYDSLLHAANNMDKMLEALTEFICASDDIPRGFL